MAGAGKGSKSGDVKESTDSSTTIEEDEKGKQNKIKQSCSCKILEQCFSTLSVWRHLWNFVDHFAEPKKFKQYYLE